MSGRPQERRREREETVVIPTIRIKSSNLVDIAIGLHEIIEKTKAIYTKLLRVSSLLSDSYTYLVYVNQLLPLPEKGEKPEHFTRRLKELFDMINRAEKENPPITVMKRKLHYARIKLREYYNLLYRIKREFCGYKTSNLLLNTLNDRLVISADEWRELEAYQEPEPAVMDITALKTLVEIYENIPYLYRALWIITITRFMVDQMLSVIAEIRGKIVEYKTLIDSVSFQAVVESLGTRKVVEVSTIMPTRKWVYIYRGFLEQYDMTYRTIMNMDKDMDRLIYHLQILLEAIKKLAILLSEY